MDLQPSMNFWEKFQFIIEQVSQTFDNQWRKRKRVLTTHFLVLFIFKLVLSKNKQGYNSMLCELWDAASRDERLVLPQQSPLAASSICEARQKLPEIVFQKINQEVLLHWNKEKVSSRWQGHRVFAIDGSKLNLPHELSNEGYKIQSKEHRHYPTGLISSLYHLSDGMIYDFSLRADLDERLAAIEHMAHLSAGDILVLDRGYFSYLFLYKSIEKNIKIICRMQPGTVNGEIKSFWDSEKTEAIIQYYPSSFVKSKLKARGFNLVYKKIPLRLFKYTIDSELYVCATTLMGGNYPLDEFHRLYHGRWGIEELYKISKQFIEIEDFHAKTERGVKQELYAHMLLINIARIFEFEAKNKLPPSTSSDNSTALKDSYWQGFCKDLQALKINFKNCLLVVARYLELLFLASSHTIINWLPNAIASIARVRQKIRPARHCPRRSFKPIKKWASRNNPMLGRA
ncbi:MAG: IS4 family transposase [Oscillospiraceae bacterium]